jgi:hypothetical protein
MCNFLSAIVMRNWDLLCDPFLTDSHEDLLSAHNVRDGLCQHDAFVRVEFIPPKDSPIHNLSTWTLKVDQANTPDWFDSERATNLLKDRVQRMIVADERELLLGGCWILVGEAKIKRVQNARIFSVSGNSQINEMRVEFSSGSAVGKFSGWNDVAEFSD